MHIPDFSFWSIFKKTEGAFSVTEAVALYNICLEAPKGDYLELGSYKLKSASVAAIALQDGDFYLVDPLFKDDNFCEGVMKNKMFRTNMILVGDVSLNEIPRHDSLAYVMIDSADHDELVLEEVKQIEDRVMQNGIVAMHDIDSQFKCVRQAYDYLLSTGKYIPIPIDWSSIINYVRENDLEKGNNSWHHTEMDFPCFVGAVKRV